MSVLAYIGTGIFAAACLYGAWKLTSRVLRAAIGERSVKPEHKAPRAELPPARARLREFRDPTTKRFE